MKCAVTLLLVLMGYCVYMEVTRAQDDVLELFPEFHKLKKGMENINNQVKDINSHPQCRKTKKGLEYKGTMSTTINGRTCQAWNAQTTHKYSGYDNLKNDANYCRGITDEPEPWCYTTDPNVRFEFCDIPYCGIPSLGFTVVNPTDVTVQNNANVKFTQVVSSSISGYDSSTGVFTAPMDGTYLFILSARTLGDRTVYFSIEKNGKKTVVLFIRSKLFSHPSPFEADSASVVLSLKKGDKVNGKCISSECFIDDGSTFTGVYL